MRLSFRSACLLWLAAAAPLAAQLAVTPAALDFGDRGHNENPSLELTVTNTTSVAIGLREIKPSCSCIKAAAPAQEIAPGASVDIQVSMGSGRALGNLDKYLEIQTRDATAPALRVPVRMRVFEGLVQEPRDLRFEGVCGGEPTTLSFQLHWGPPLRGPVALHVDEVKVVDGKSISGGRPVPHFTTRVTADGMARRVDVTLLPSHPEGRIWANLEAKVNGKLLVVPIAGEMFRHIKVSPTHFNFNRVARDEPKSFVQETVLASTDGKGFKILGVTAQHPPNQPAGWKIHFEPVEGGNAARTLHTVRARIEVGETWAAGASLSGKAVVRTDHPEKPEITLPFFGFFAAPRK